MQKCDSVGNTAKNTRNEKEEVRKELEKQRSDGKKLKSQDLIEMTEKRRNAKVVIIQEHDEFI